MYSYITWTPTFFKVPKKYIIRRKLFKLLIRNFYISTFVSLWLKSTFVNCTCVFTSFFLKFNYFKQLLFKNTRRCGSTFLFLILLISLGSLWCRVVAGKKVKRKEQTCRSLIRVWQLRKLFVFNEIKLFKKSNEKYGTTVVKFWKWRRQYLCSQEWASFLFAKDHRDN